MPGMALALTLTHLESSVKRLGQQLGRAWTALCQADFAETSDFGARMRRLGVPEQDIAIELAALGRRPSLARPRKLIVLAVKGQASQAAQDYVCEAIPRLHADVAVVSALGAVPLARGFANACAAYGARLIEPVVLQTLEAGLRSFLRRYPQTMFLVYGDSAPPRRWMSALALPVVHVQRTAAAFSLPFISRTV